ncbi:hypothetical protein A9404_11370 [Halothiobacillus diazotrophicus]|uniref:Thioredoxin domain-containing protein n=1 Tax=Halothiobacillus diazotrophicus TaxID=1860122 RepID=A0A191ZJ21_9GAMM|nr:hypothetical protein [Halothiobacillus diazotrophicus]ANJ67896.1 hypothetical protein A9404_11370 [Halothiobacillus diazotrophicus]
MEGVSSMLPQRKIPIVASLLVIFGLPLLMAWFVFNYYGDTFRGGLEHGELITPVRQLDPPPMHNLQGGMVSADLFRGKWTLLYRAPDGGNANADGAISACNADCLALMDTLRRVRIAQDRSMREVQRVLVLPASAAQVPGIADQFDKGLNVVTATDWPLQAGSVYLIDPQGFVALRYPPGFEPTGLLKDLKRLLRLAGK